ncbi:glycosyltransferase family 39 protein [Candidatus Woesearchaeota archaeon]|nr:glycosyltransferase family 39 protein [Candidatus Woesearchaeota archaeon]
MEKKTIFLIIFAIFIFGIRLANINEALYDDEANFAYSLTVMDKWGFNHDYPSPQPLNLIYKPFIAVFGLETWVFRIVPWLFGIINTLLVYFFARRHWDEKVAFWATLLMLVSFYPTLASLQFDVEGNLVMFSIILFIFSYLEYKKNIENKKRLFWQIISGIGLGLAVATKYNSFFLAAVPALYSFFMDSDRFLLRLKKAIKDIYFIYFIGLIIFIGITFMGFIASPEKWLYFVPIISWADGFGTDYRPQSIGLLGPMLFFLWSTPLLFGFYILSFFQERKKILLPLIWVTLTLLFYTFGMTYGSMDRYFMHTIPALVILGGYFLSKISFQRKEIAVWSFLIIIWTTFLFLVNSLPSKSLARFPSIYFEEIKHRNINFLFSYTSASGPTFGVNFATVFVTSVIALLCIFFYILAVEKMTSRAFILIFFLATLSFNIFLVSEYLFHPTGADISGVKLEMVQYVKEQELKKPIYTNDEGIQWYFDHWYKNKNNLTLGFGDNELEDVPIVLKDSIANQGGTIILVRWPPLPSGSTALKVIKLCTLQKQFYSNRETFGEIYLCQPDYRII